MSPLHRALSMMILTFLTAASAASAADPTPPPTPRDEAVAQAKKLMKQGRHRDAAEAFRKAGKLGEGPCFDCLVGLAGALSGLDRHGEAVAVAREALQIESIHPTRVAQSTGTAPRSPCPGYLPPSPPPLPAALLPGGEAPLPRTHL